MLIRGKTEKLYRPTEKWGDTGEERRKERESTWEKTNRKIVNAHCRLCRACESASQVDLCYSFLVSVPGVQDIHSKLPARLTEMVRQQHVITSFQNSCPTTQPCTQRQDKCHIYVSEEVPSELKPGASTQHQCSAAFLQRFSPYSLVPRSFHGFICPNHAVSQIVILALCLSCSYL